MTTRVTAKNILLNEFIDNFNTTTPVSYTNNDTFFFTTLSPTTKPTDEPWVRFMIQDNFSIQASIGGEGGRNFDRKGIISYQVFIPINKGTFTGDTLCEEINDIFEGKRFNGVICETGTWIEIGATEDDLYQFNGSIPFWFYQKK